VFQDSGRRERYQQKRLHKVTRFIFALSIEIPRDFWFYPLKFDHPLRHSFFDFLPRVQICDDCMLVILLFCLFLFCSLSFHRCFLAISLHSRQPQLRLAIWPEYTLKGALRPDSDLRQVSFVFWDALNYPEALKLSEISRCGHWNRRRTNPNIPDLITHLSQSGHNNKMSSFDLWLWRERNWSLSMICHYGSLDNPWSKSIEFPTRDLQVYRGYSATSLNMRIISSL
jgi:hypothetical protein